MSDKNKVYESYNKIADWFYAHRSRDLNMELKHLNRMTALLAAGVRILDLGCGTGRPIAQHLLSQGFRVKGVDGSQKMIDLALKYVPEIQPELQDMRHLNLSEKFAAIIMWHSSFHLPIEDQRALLKNLKNFLAPQGCLLFTSGPSEGEAWGENGGENLFHASLSQEEYRQILGDQGFEVLSLDVEDQTAGGATVWLCRLR